MSYVFLVIAVVCFGFQFVVTKIYQKYAGVTFFATCLFCTGVGAVSAFLFLCLNKFRWTVTPFSAAMAAVFSVCLAASVYVGILAMSGGKVAVFTLFIMLGGMLLPFLYGAIFLRERVGVWRWIALVLMVGALILPCLERKREKNTWLFYLLCVLAFFLNGAGSIVSKAHQVSVHAVPTFDFMISVFVCMTLLGGVLCVPAYLLRKKRGVPSCAVPELAATQESPRPRYGLAVLGMLGYALCSSVGNCTQLLGARNLPAVLLFPVITGGTVILSALFGRIFFGEKIHAFVWTGIVATLVATCLFLF